MNFWEDALEGSFNDAPVSSSGPKQGDLFSVQEDLRHAQARIDKLSLTCQALWEILRDNTGLTDEMLLQKVQEIDLRDGQADGKMSGAKVGSSCPKCSRPLNRKHRKCLYCGYELTAKDKQAFEV